MSLNMKSFKALRLRQVIEKTGVSRAQIYKLVKDGKFPKSHNLSDTGCIVAWEEFKIDEWLKSKFTEESR